MEQINIVSELYEKFKKNSKLSVADKEKAKEILINLLKDNETREAAIELIIKFPEDTGIAAYIEYYKTLSFDKQINLNKSFVSNKEFLANTSFRSINRGTALIGNMLREGQFGSAFYIMKNVCRLIGNGNSKGVAPKIIDAFQKNIINEHDKGLLSIKLEKCEDKDYYNIEKVMINSAFELIKEQPVKPVTQYGILTWLFKSGRKIKFTGHEKGLVQNVLNNWPDEIKKMIYGDEELKNAYEGTINFNEVMNTKSVETVTITEPNETYKIERKNEDENKIAKKQPTENYDQPKEENKAKSGRLKDTLLRIAKEVEELESDLKSKDEKIETIKVILNSTQKQYEQKMFENEKLAQKNDNITVENNTLRNEVENKRIELKLLEDELNKLKASEFENKKKIEALLDMDNREDSYALKEFKNKLAGKLKYHYTDFKEVEDYKMSEDLGENLRIQMKEVFNILINQGIIL